MSTPAAGRQGDRAEWGLWLGLLLPPAAWFGAQQLGFVLAPWVCVTGKRWILFAVTAAALVTAAAGGVAAWSRWNVAGDSASSGPLQRRRRQLAAAGMLLSLFFLLAIAAFSIPDLLQRPCD